MRGNKGKDHTNHLLEHRKPILRRICVVFRHLVDLSIDEEQQLGKVLYDGPSGSRKDIVVLQLLHWQFLLTVLHSFSIVFSSCRDASCVRTEQP